MPRVTYGSYCETVNKYITPETDDINSERTFPLDRADDQHLDVLQNIKFGLKREYEDNGGLTDAKTIYGLDNVRIAVKQMFGYAKNEKAVIDKDTEGIIGWCLTVAKERIVDSKDCTLKEYLACIEKIKGSVKRHSDYGCRGYYEFIKDYV